MADSNVMGPAVVGVMGGASGSASGANGLLRFNLGYWQVYDGDFWSYSQQGDLSSPSRSGDDITAIGPRGAARFVRRQWNVSQRLVIFVVNGQSNSLGVTANAVDVDPIILQPPLPTKFMCAPGGLMPIQDGDLSAAVGTLIDADCYQDDLVPAKENINTFRDPGKEVNRQSWASAFGQTVAAALPDDGSLVAIVNVSHGSTTFAQDVYGSIAFSSVTWSAGVATIVFSADTGLEAGDVLDTVNPGGTWPASLTLATSDGTTATVNIASNPGTFSGSLLGMQPPMVSARRVVRYWHDTVAPALGLTTYFGGLLYNGNEANDTYTADWLTGQDDPTRDQVDALAAYCDNAVDEPAWIIRGQVGYNVATWSVLPTTMLNCGSNVSMAPLRAAIDPARYNIVFPQYSSEPGVPADAAATGNFHYQVQGHHDNGSRAGNLFLDAVTGDADHEPVYLLDGESNLVRLANSTTITGTYSRAVVLDPDREIADPGDSGFQVSSGVAGITAAENLTNGTNGLVEDIIDTVAVDGTDLEITLSQLPAYPWGNRLGYADGVGTVYRETNPTKLLSVSYSGGNATYEFTEPHGLSVGDSATIVRCIPTGFDIVGVTTIAGTTGTTLVAPLAGGDPGTVSVTAGTWTALGGGRATITFSPAQSQNIIINGNWVTLVGCSPSGWNGSFEIFSNPSTTSITVKMPNNPGTFVSGGTINGFGQMAIEGAYELGNQEGPRGTVRGAVIDHYDNATGFALPRWAARQRAIVDVYTSTKSIAGMLTELGALDETTDYDDFFQLVLDFGNSSCYGGSGNTITNLATTGNDTNYYRGLSSSDTTKTPTFNGAAGAGDRTAYFEAATDGKVFTPSNASSTLMADAHKPGGSGTIIALIRMPVSTPANPTYLLANARSTGSGQGPGFAFRSGVLSGNYSLSLLIRGEAGASIYSTSLTSPAIIAGNYALVAVSWEDGDASSWIMAQSETGEAAFTTFNCAYTAVSTSAAQTVPVIWRNGTGTVEAEEGCQIMALLASDRKMSREQARPLLRSLYRRQLLNLP